MTRQSDGRPVRRRGYFVQRTAFPWERPSIMRKHIYTGAMGNIWAHLISGIFFVYYGNAIGMTQLQWGLMAGFSSWVIAAQLFSARIAELTGQRKRVWFWLAMGDRVLRFVGIATALWIWAAGGSHAPVVLMTAICLANLLGAMGSPPWLSWLADIIPENEHGAFWGRRSMWIAVATMISVVPAGLLMDWVPEQHKLAAALGIFGVATAVGVLDLIIHGTIPEPAAETVARTSILRSFWDPLADRAFRPWLVFNGVWTFAMTLGGALSTLYFIDQLGISRNFAGGTIVLTSVSLLGAFLSSRTAGSLVDRYGPPPVLFAGHLIWSLLPLFWVLATPESALLFLAAASIVGGLGAEAAQNAANKFIVRTPPPDKRASYTAVSSTLGNIAGGLGVIIAGALLQLMADTASPAFLETTGGGFRILFAASLALRLFSSLVLLPRIGSATRYGPPR